ncbi:ERV/ALR sulfhydryl oxidase domain-containing protein [Xylariaceae sp. FL1272]|nr:ERV/ALR sulfhydryl oxidase domain-containing protein [Xylariaceae sp. FL1272]
MPRHLSILITIVVAGFLILSLTSSSFSGGLSRVSHNVASSVDTKDPSLDFGVIPSSILTGGSIAPKLENATAKAELGRAAWRVIHTTMARFPEKPTEEESATLKIYIQAFARLYPCGDCASHFQGLLKKFPPQVGSRNAAAAWACHVHNQVNKRLKKEEFNCNNIGDFYDCGCGDKDEKAPPMPS